MTREQYENLKRFEKHLRRGFYGNYVYGLYESDFSQLYQIYKELGGTERLRYACNVCCLRLTKFLGKLYFEWEPDENPVPVEVVEAVLEENVDEVEEVEEQEEEPKKPKRKTRKTKKDGGNRQKGKETD